MNGVRWRSITRATPTRMRQQRFTYSGSYAACTRSSSNGMSLSTSFTRPLFRTPSSDVLFLFDILRTAPEDAAAVQRLVDANRALFQRNRALGGTLYPISAVPLSRLGWRQHYGPHWDSLVSAKRLRSAGRAGVGARHFPVGHPGSGRARAR